MERFDKLFDVINSSNFHDSKLFRRPLMTTSKLQLDYLDNRKEFLYRTKFKKNGKLCELLPCQAGLIMTIMSI